MFQRLRQWAAVGGLTVAAVLAVAAPAAAADAPWSTHCVGNGPERNCTISSKLKYPSVRGTRDEVLVSLIQDADCRTLHITFDRAIDLDRPVTLSVDQGNRHSFYTGAELSRLARALDENAAPTDVPPEFLHFFRQVESGAIDGGDKAGQEMVARFALVKEPRRIGMACVATERLLSDLRAGKILRLEFHHQPRSTPQVYHWPRLTERTTDIRLDGLAAALDALTSAPLTSAPLTSSH